MVILAERKREIRNVSETTSSWARILYEHDIKSMYQIILWRLDAAIAERPEVNMFS